MRFILKLLIIINKQKNFTTQRKVKLWIKQRGHYLNQQKQELKLAKTPQNQV